MCHLFVDGASRGNPGPASVGASLQKDGQEIASVSKAIGIATNNVAEYHALIEGLACAISHNIQTLHIKADSQLMVRQVLGQYKVKHPDIKPLFAKVKDHLQKFESYTIEHVRREHNTRADELANLALDA